MSPRPRTATNAEILSGAVRAVGRVGPARLTLADVARETKLAPATLIQRFGSKRALLLAALEHEGSATAGRMSAVRSTHRSPLAALFAAASAMVRGIETPDALANHTAFLQLGLSDPDFRRVALATSRWVIAEYRALIAAAIAVGELTPTNADRLAQSVHTVVNGSLVNWAIHRDGALIPWVRAELDAVLAAHRPRDRATPAVAPAVLAPAVIAPAVIAPAVIAPAASTMASAGDPPRPPAGPRARHKL